MDAHRTDANATETQPAQVDAVETDGVTKSHAGASHRKRHGKALLATIGATTAVALAAGGVAAATSGPTDQPAAATAPASTGAKRPHATRPRLQRLLHRTVHAQFVLRTRGSGFQTFDYDRGVLRSVTPTTIVIAPADAPTTTVTATITSKTHFQGLAQSKLQAGDRVALLYQGGDAVAVVARAPKSATSAKG